MTPPVRPAQPTTRSPWRDRRLRRRGGLPHPLRLFTAHLSGNTARLGVELGRGDLSAAMTYAVPVAVFFTAVAPGAGWTESCRTTGRRALGPLLVLEALLVTLVLGTVLRDAGGRRLGRPPTTGWR